jgi:hypothetical protein
MATVNIAYGSYTSMTVTNLNSLASSATAGWQSARVDNQTSVKAIDYEIAIKLDMANTAPANDKCVYVFISPGVTTDGGTTWLMADGGTTTLPGGSEGTYTIGGTTTTNNLVLLGTMAYTAQDQIMQAVFMLSNAFGNSMPDGFQIILVNYTGAAIAASGNVVAYRAITQTVA